MLFEMPELLTLDGSVFTDIDAASEKGGGCSIGCEAGCSSGCDPGGGTGKPPVVALPGSEVPSSL